MKIRIGGDASVEEASAIAEALAAHVDRDVEVYLGDADEPAAVESAELEVPIEDDLGPTEREERLREEIAEILEGGPERYKERLPEQGKLFVRDRIDLWFGEDGMRFEDGRFAAFDSEDRLPADGLITGAAEFEGRDVHFMANDFTVKAGSMAERGVEKFLRMQQRALKTGRPVLYLMDSSGGRIDQQSGFFANREGIGKYYYN
ncbi:MAG: carboxyl transferase domain-containing protein, partial [Haloarculaceae archaeon]